jgi:hypothetical protein
MVISNLKKGNFEKQSGELKTKWGTKIKHFKQVPNNLAQLKRGYSIPKHHHTPTPTLSAL